MVDIILLEQLVAFAQYGTLSEAAEKLYTTQPVLTRHMKKLESELGLTLFVRGKNRLALTETGKQAALYAERVLQAHTEFERQIHAYDRSLRTISIGYCAPVPQDVLTPLLNSLWSGMTISADMKDDASFLQDLQEGHYQLAVTHFAPEDTQSFAYKKCGHEDLFLSVTTNNPLTFYPEIHMKDLEGQSILLFNRLGFWSEIPPIKTYNINYLLQIQRSTFCELAKNSAYPIFTSSCSIMQNKFQLPGRVKIAIADAQCHCDYYLVCLKKDYPRFKRLFAQISEDTIQ